MTNREQKRRTFITILVVALVGCSIAWAQSKVDQGKPGVQGPWPVAIVSGGGGTTTLVADGGIAIYPLACRGTSPHGYTSVGTASTNVPAAAAAGRYYVRVCLSYEASGQPQLKCRTDGTPPAFGATPGEVLAPGDCVTYALAAATNVACIATAASTPVSTFECQ